MSTFTFPYWAKPVLQFYNLSWPDIDEDKVAELGPQIQDAANAAWLFCITVKAALGTLSEQSESEALEAFHQDWGSFTSGTVQPFTEGVGSMAVSGTLAVANGITLYKAGVLSTLTINIGSDIALIATGVGIPVAAAKKALLHETLHLLLEEAARQAASWLVTQWNDAVEEHITGPIEKLATDIGKDLGGAARAIVGMAVEPVTHAVGVGAARLYIDEHDVIDAVAKVARALDNLVDKVEKLSHWTKGTGFTEPTPVPDPIVSLAIKEVADWTSDAIVGELKQIGNDILNQVIDVLTSTYEKYVEADTTLGTLAGKLREQFHVTVPAHPYVIDRSTRPRPIMVLDAPPPIITGQGLSAARDEIEVIDLPDRPAPVVTGAGESDARLSIRQIVLPGAADPVVTGAADSGASDGITTVELSGR